MAAATKPITLTLGHSPDPDDAFMWWPLLSIDGRPPRIRSPRFAFEAAPLDIERLNQCSESAEFDITAMSCAHYPHVQDRYILTACGASVGDGCGPRLVCREHLSFEQLIESGEAIAVPGTRTSAFAALTLRADGNSFPFRVVAFDEIIAAVAGGSFLAGLVIHEGQLTHEQSGLHLIEDLGAWWMRSRDLPLPLGVNAVRRDLDQSAGTGALAEVTNLLQHSVHYALSHRRESIEYAMRFARGIDAALADRFIDMYVNRWTLDFGAVGLRAVRTFLNELAGLGLCPSLEGEMVATAAARGMK